MKNNNPEFFLILLFFAFLTHFVRGQQPYMRNFTDEDGLPSLTVYDIFQDSKDYIWMGTDKGLCRYDGRGFMYYRNANQKGMAINGLKEDSYGRVWCKNFNNQVFYIENDSLNLISIDLTNNNIGKIDQIDIDVNDRLWIGATYKVLSYRINDKSWDSLNIYQFRKERIGNFGLAFLAVDNSDNIWMGPLNAPIRKYNRQKGFCTLANNEVRTTNQTSNKLIDFCPLSPFPTNYGLTYFLEICIKEKSLENSVLYSRNDTIIRINSISKYLNKVQTICLYSNNPDQLWISSYKGALLVEQPLSEIPKISTYLSNIAVSKVLEDKEGNIWFSTLNNGVYFMPNNQVLKHKIEHVKEANLAKLSKKNSTQLVLGISGTMQLLYDVFQKKVISSYRTNNERNNESMFYDSSVNKLFIHQGDFFGFDGDNKLEPIKENRLPNVKKIIPINKTYLLLGTRTDARIIRKDFGSIDKEFIMEITKKNLYEKNLYFSEDGLFIRFAYPNNLNNFCIAVHPESIGKYWLGFLDTLRIYDFGEIRPVLDEAGNIISASEIVETKDSIIWVATTTSGLIGFKEEKPIYHFTTYNGLISQTIIGLESDGNALWIVSNKGLQLLDESHRYFKTYNRADGLISNEINDIEILGGQVWLATPKGLISFDKNMPSVNSYAPPVYLSGLAINGEDTVLLPRYELPYHRNNFFITFQGIAYRSQGNFSYKYRMLGLSEEWVTVNGAQNELRFMSLNPGDYHLEIYCVNEDGVASKNPISIDFCIHPPFWLTWWFWSLIGGGILLSAGAIAWWQFSVYRRRQALILQMQQLRTQALQSQMNPHFIFNAMNAIQKLMVQDTMENALGYMAKFAKLIRMIFEISGQQAIPLEEEIDFLQLYLDLEKLRFKNKVTIDFQVDEALLDDFYFIPPLFIQPIIENSFKHGLMHKEEMGHLIVAFKKEGDFLYVKVEDNGVGRKRAAELSEWKQEKRKKSGLVVTEERLAMLPPHSQHPKNFLMTDLLDDKETAIGLCTELWISFTNPEKKENGD